MYKIIKLLVCGLLFCSHVDAFDVKSFFIGTLFTRQHVSNKNDFLNHNIETKSYFLRGSSPETYRQSNPKDDDTTEEMDAICKKILRKSREEKNKKIIECSLFLSESNDDAKNSKSLDCKNILVESEKTKNDNVVRCSFFATAFK